jgi:uncharacterized protein
MGNAVVHWELMSKDPEKVSAFYAKLFGWKIDHRPEHNYRIVDTGAEGEMRGINAGGKIHVEQQKVPGMGKFALFTDPEGRMMGLWKAKTK